MFNAAWPKLYWQFFDYYLMPNGAFYGAMKGCQPLNIVYNYKDKNIYLVNDYLESFSGLKASAKIYDSDSKLIFEKEKTAAVNDNSSKKVIDIPVLNYTSSLIFINLELKDSVNKLITDNFYWVSSKEDSLDFKNSDWYYTPMKSYSDLRGINNLPAAAVKYEEKFYKNNVEVSLENTSDKVAFFIELKVVDKETGASFLPVYWTDNYISILPHSKKIVGASFKNPLNKKPELIINGWNIKKSL
jgi:exo-1,4-beta-D-glucosaminidase